MPTLLELVQSRVSLKRRGRVWWGCCPWHKDKTSSFKVEEYRGKWRYHCFSCGQRGDAIDWLMRWESLSFKDASEQLGKPYKPDPAIAEMRRQEAWREHQITAYLRCNPDCVCPDFLFTAPPCPASYKVPIWQEPRRFTEEELDRICAVAIWTLAL